LPGQAQQPSQPAADNRLKPQKNWKDRAEYDIYNAIVKEQDANKAELLNTWKEKIPGERLRSERLQVYLTTYNA